MECVSAFQKGALRDHDSRARLGTGPAAQPSDARQVFDLPRHRRKIERAPTRSGHRPDETEESFGKSETLPRIKEA